MASDDEMVPMVPITCASCTTRVGWSDQNLNDVITMPGLAVIICDHCMQHPEQIEERLARDT